VRISAGQTHSYTIDEDSIRRIAIIGTSCCGKSTLAKEMASILGAEHIELDTLFWEPNWQQSPLDVFRGRVECVVAGDKWIIDGNYSPVQPIILERATMVIWLDYSFSRIFARALRRTISRAITGKELFSGNRESFRGSFLSKESILIWVVKSHRKLKNKYARLFAKQGNSDTVFLRLPHPRDMKEFLIKCLEFKRQCFW